MGDYKVGYGKPPEHSRFKAGESGNSRGRPRGRISTARLLEKHMDAKVTINIGGKPKKVSRREALVLSAIGDAFKGSERVRRHFLDLVLSFDALLQAEAAPVIDSAQDQAVIDALLYSYGVKTGADAGAGEIKTKKTGKTTEAKKGE
jgi:Family of unknown function (DUF5681)